MIPPPRLCDTPGCGTMVPTDHDPDGIDQVHGKMPAWVWDCRGCGRKRIEPVRDASSFVDKKEEVNVSAT